MTMPFDLDPIEESPNQRPTPRRYSLDYKKRIVAEYEALPSGGGQKGSLLRRERLARRQISEWRRILAGETVSPARRSKRTPDQIEIEKLRATNLRLQAELDRSRLALQISGKAFALLELFSESAGSGTLP